jgi:surface antigen Omp85-like protein/WD40 repeat protein
MRGATRLIGALVVSVSLCAASARASTLFDPTFRFRTIRTPHFVIYFHQGEDRLAGRLAVIAEEAWRALEHPLGVKPPPLTHVVLADQSEQAGGTATPVPYNTIVLDAAWPTGSELIGNVDDWLRLAFTHEFTHITHLDRSEGWARTVRNVFGRVPLAFPNLYLPIWQIEGLATYEESAITGEGRLHDGNFRAIEDEAARQHALEPLDRVNGGLVDWPGGLAPYAYGVGFHQYLVDRFGPEKLAVLAEATARRVPYTGSRVFRRVYGKSLGDLWSDYQATVVNRVVSAPADAGLTRLTYHRFTVAGPRFDRFACATCPPELFYSVQTPHSLPGLNRIRLDGTEPRRLTTRILGSTMAIGRDAIYFDQQDLRRNTGFYSDLYERSRGTGLVRRLTFDARLLEPDLSPDGRTFVAVQSRPGQRDLVLIHDVARDVRPRLPGSDRPARQIETLISEADTQFNAPRWSPDGRTIAVERHRLGAAAEVALVDVATKTIRVVAADPRGRAVTPAWRPDGRAIVVALAHEDEPFSLYEIGLDAASAARRLTHLTGGATWPDVSPDGHTLAFVGYTAEGFELFSMPYPEAVPAGQDPRVRPAEALAARADARIGIETPIISTSYSPLRTLRPTSWSPVIDDNGDRLRAGATLFASDVLGYHLFAATATWLVARPAGSLPASREVPDWHVSYVYDRWRPSLFVGASTETSFFTGLDSITGRPLPVTLRERWLEAGVRFPIVHVRQRSVGQLSIVRATDAYTLAGREVSRDRTAIRVAGAFTSAHRYSASISQEDGVAAGVTAELVRRELGADADAARLTGDVRAYLPALGPHHVIALRAVGATTTGDPSFSRTFLMGGSARDTGLIDFGSAPTTLMRGFPSDTFGGRHAALLNVEYRVPLARPQRGLGTWPLFLRTIHAAAFTDAGHVWTTGFRASDLKSSFGVELSVDAVAGFFLPVTATVGAAWGHDGSGNVPDRTALYIQLGHAF